MSKDLQTWGPLAGPFTLREAPQVPGAPITSQSALPDLTAATAIAQQLRNKLRTDIEVINVWGTPVFTARYTGETAR